MLNTTPDEHTVGVGMQTGKIVNARPTVPHFSESEVKCCIPNHTDKSLGQLLGTRECLQRRQLHLLYVVYTVCEQFHIKTDKNAT